MRKLLILIILYASWTFSAGAQTTPYVQGGSVNAAPDTIYGVTGSWAEGGPVYSYTFPQTLVAPCTILVSLRQPGQIVSDTQGNIFTPHGQLWTSNSCANGPDTVQVSCSSLCWSQFTVSQYSGSWTLDQQSPINTGTGTTTSTALITPTQSGELIVGIGNNQITDTPFISPETGWTLRANADEFIEDTIQTTSTPVASTVTYSTANTWTQTTFSFVLTLAPVTRPVIVNISATYDDGSVPTILTVNIADITSVPSTTLSLTPDPITGVASGTLTIVSTKTYEVILFAAGSQIGQTFYDGGLVLTLMPQISQANFSIVLFKATGAVKSFTSSAQ